MSYSAIHVGSCWKYRREGKLKIQTIQNLNTTQKKRTTNAAKQNYPGSVAYTQPGNEVGLFYNAPKLTCARFG